MTLKTWLIYLSTGRLFIWLLQTNGLMRPLWNRNETLKELGGCDLCLGVWVYLLLAWRLPDAFSTFPKILEKFTLAALTSLIAHLLRIGWQTKFGVTVIE